MAGRSGAWRGNVVLLLLVAGLVLYLALGGSPEKPKRIGGATTTQLLMRSIWEAKTVKIIRKTGLEPMLLSLDVDTGKFEITDPVRDVASLATLKSMFTVYDSAQLLEGLTEDELRDNPEFAKKAGLDEPKGSIEIRYADNTVLIEFGETGSKDSEVFLRLGGPEGKIYRGPRSLLTSIQHNPDDIREKVLFTDRGIGAAKRVRIERLIEGKTRVDVVERLPKVGYRIVEPKNLRVDIKVLEGLIRELGGLRLDAFVSGMIKSEGRDRPIMLRLEVDGEFGSETLEIEQLGGGGPYLGLLKNRGISFRIGGQGLARLWQWTDLLRAKHLIAYKEKEIRRVEIEAKRGDDPMIWVRNSLEEFGMHEPFRIACRETPVSAAIYALAHLEAKSFVDEPPADTGVNDGDPYLVVRVGGDRKGTGMTELRFGNANEDGDIYARRSDEPYVVLLPADVVDPLRRPWTEFVSDSAYKMDRKAFCIEAYGPGKTEPVVYVKAEEWTREGQTEEIDDVRNFADRIQQLRANAVLPATVVGSLDRAVRVVLRQGQDRQSGTIGELRLVPHDVPGDSGKPGKRYTVLVPPGATGVVYLLKDGIFRKLVDDWSR